MGCWSEKSTSVAFEQTQITHGRFVERREGDFLLRPSPARSFGSASTLAGTDAERVQLETSGRLAACPWLLPRPMSTGMTLRFAWEPVPDGPAGLVDARRRLLGTKGTWSPAERVLLDQLAASGTELLYHGDFDWGGLRIANLVMKRHGARPWRFATEDYLAAVGASGKKLDPDRIKRAAASWDPHLEEVMVERGRAVHEEQLLDVLLADLAETA